MQVLCVPGRIPIMGITIGIFNKAGSNLQIKSLERLKNQIRNDKESELKKATKFSSGCLLNKIIVN